MTYLRVAATVGPVVLLALLVVPVASHAAPLPADAFINQQIDQLNQILGREKSAQLPALRAAYKDVLDFDGFTEKALGSHFATLTDKQRKGMRDAMQDLLESRYLVGDAKPFDRKLVTLGEVRPSANGDGVEVEGTVKQAEVDIQFIVKMRAVEDRWKVYDVVIDGQSLVEDYRSQFSTFLKKRSVDELIKRLHSRAQGQGKAD